MQSGLGNLFYEAVAVVKRTFFEPPISIVEHSRQGGGSKTYIITFADGTKKVLQLRSANRTIPIEDVRRARHLLGELVPEVDFCGTFGEDGGLHGVAYSMACLPGMDLARFMQQPAYDSETMLPIIAAGVGALLGKCSTGVQPKKAGASCIALEEQISAIRANMRGPKFNSYRVEMLKLLGKLSSLDELPLAITNGDVHFANLMIDDNGRISGLVDWEFVQDVPMGNDLDFIHRLRGYWDHDSHQYVERSNCGVIEAEFWGAVFSNMRFPVDEEVLQNLETCMRIKACSVYGMAGCEEIFPMEMLQMELDYKIPRSLMGWNITDEV
ncbi:hypothetical protein CALVIDRAFT_594120 [Calocera viscosa TUFC12733]|uniref:Aminoglycoside phosphotransferase domain-containing protein n=1 Tax=Calocera viscosa (strain TUFC12733) TaxID=1330018 RepID=A0A167RXV9_CALVF|nr:hypothetical protein CALVIDRAFT_594120 [Calocera viscosa TUFC12733]